MIQENTLALLCDFYELTMGRGYFHTEMRNKIAYFDVFYRKNPDGGGYAIAAGLEQIAEYVINKLTVAFEFDLFGKTRGRNCFFFFLATA